MFDCIVVEPVRPEQYYRLPYRHYAGDCGYDLFVSENMVIPPGEYRDVPTNIKCQLPAMSWGFIVGRSSAFRKQGLMVQPGIIDNGYRGELFSAAYNTNSHNVALYEGDRVAQLIIIPLCTPPVSLGAVSPSDRGDAGFGSTGV